jgi:hypothetical protein
LNSLYQSSRKSSLTPTSLEALWSPETNWDGPSSAKKKKKKEEVQDINSASEETVSDSPGGGGGNEINQEEEGEEDKQEKGKITLSKEPLIEVETSMKRNVSLKKPSTQNKL